MASANMTIQVRFDEEQLEQLADLIVAKLDVRPPKVSEVVEKELDKPKAKQPEVKPTGDAGKGRNTDKDDVEAWDGGFTNLHLNEGGADYDDDYEAIELHDLTNAELEQVILDNPLIAPLHKSKMVKDELVQLVEVGFAVDSGEFGELLKDDLLLAAEALGVRDEVTTKTRKDEVLKVVDKAYSNR